MPEGLEKQIDVPAMADLLAYLNSIKPRSSGKPLPGSVDRSIHITLGGFISRMRIISPDSYHGRVCEYHDW